MENDGMDESDLGSGWLEVKKKHRSSSRFSVRSTSEVSSRKTCSARPHFRQGGNVGWGRHPKYSRTSPIGVSHETASNGNVSSSSSAVDTVEGCSDKVMAVRPCYLSCKGTELVGNRQECLHRVPKIKWGDLDDDALIVSKCSTDFLGTCKVGCGHVASLDDKAAVSIDPLTSVSPLCPLEEGRAAAILEDSKSLQDEAMSESVIEESLEENCREVNEIPSEDAHFKGLAGDISCSNITDACFEKVHDNLTEQPSQYEDGADPAGVPCPSMALQEMTMPEPQLPKDKHQNEVLELSKLPIVENSSIQEFDPCGDNASLPLDDIGVTIEEHDSLSEGLVLADDGREESKERFRQRLWCFLFENLNRAMDELYLLCELECDMEQIEEVMLVLDEAGSDFKELKSRVEGFEQCKKFPSQFIREGMTRTDHRRPHALSWEVRRMTTTPNRAEILSSSIEAFKKIQKERAGGYTLQELNTAGCTSSSQRKSAKLQDNVAVKKEAASSHKNIPEKCDTQSSRHALGSKKKKQVGNSVVQCDTIKDGVLSPPLSDSSRVGTKSSARSLSGVGKEYQVEHVSKGEKQASDGDKALNEMKTEKQMKSQVGSDKEKEKQNTGSWKTMDAWKEKRNWEDILRSPIRTSSRVSHSPSVARKSVDRGRVLHQKLMSPEKKRKTALDMKRDAEDRHARAMRIRSQLENERVQRLQRTSEKLNRVNEWQAVRSLKMRERMNARHQRSESRHEAYLAQVARRAGDESSKVNEVRFITSLNEENKKLILRQKLHDSEARRAEKLQVIRTKQKEDSAREEAVLERKKLLEAEKLQRIAETQRRKEEAKVRREEERKASSAAREARAVEQLRRMEVRAKAQQEEAELMAQKLAERLKESEQRRKFYLEQIRERASMDFRDISSPFRRSVMGKEGQGYQALCSLSPGSSSMGLGDGTLHMPLKRRIKKIRQRLMALKHEIVEPSMGGEFGGIGFRSVMGAARAKISRWLQELQRLRQARKEGAASIGLIVADMIKYLEDKEPELHAARKAGLIDFIASALPASHTSKPEACQVTRYFLRLLQVVLSMATNRSYFLSQNLLPPIIPMLSASLENYIKIAASSNLSGTSTTLSGKPYAENLEISAEVLDGFLCTVTKILGHNHSDERHVQMRSGLVELVVSYQIIHRLRDLFALYDRPQIEGSPFPSSILLSLNLLAVLTSRSGVASCIDWESHLLNAFPESSRNEDGLGKDSDNKSQGPLENSLNIISATFSELVSAAEEESSLPGFGGNHENELSDAAMSYKFNADESPSGLTEDGSGSIVLLKTENICEPMKDKKDVQRKDAMQKQPEAFLLSAISETGLVSLSSLLTAVLLHANNRQSPEQPSYTLPSNFEEVATGVLKVLNNIALLDINLLQNMLARPDLQMEFFHLMSFLLSHCNSKWKGANDQVGLLLLESLLLLGYFALFHPGNQEVLRWGKNPTILHKVCDLPFVFFSDPELTPILASTLVAACYGCEQNRDVVQQELSTEMLLTLLRSCRQELQCARPPSMILDSSQASDTLGRANQTAVEQPKRPPGRVVKVSRSKIQQNGKARTCEDWALKHNQPASSASSTFMLHSRLPRVLLDKAEEFFLAGIPKEPA